jgi:predicted nucleotidyltransferase
MKDNITKKEIIDILRSDKWILEKDFGVVSIGLFGSYANDRQKNDSDIDLLVELQEARFDWLAGLQLHLEKRFLRKIELIRKSAKVNSSFIKRIENEVIYVR